MVRTVITPEDTNVRLDIPSSYVGRKSEGLYYPVDELVEKGGDAPKNMASFRGILSEEEGRELQQYVEKSREEWKGVLDFLELNELSSPDNSTN
jgi:hypothetical protein